MCKIMIVDSVPVILDTLTKALSAQYQVLSGGDGEQVLPLLIEFRPDVLVIDLGVPGIDGLGVLNTAFLGGIRPKILASTTYGGDYVKNKLTELNASYLLTRPCRAQDMLAHIVSIAMELDGAPKGDLRRIANDLLLELGLRMDLQGYQYVLASVVYICGNMDCTMTGELYPDIAAHFGGNAQQVERAIRSCIQNAWLNRNEQIWSLYFSKGKNGKTVHLNNGAFLKRMAYAVNDFYAYGKSNEGNYVKSGCK